MRFHFIDDSRLKKAAQRIHKVIPERSLGVIQTAIVQALGYHDWHEFVLTHAQNPASPLTQDLAVDVVREKTLSLVVDLARKLDVPNDAVQFALSRSRLLGDRSYNWEDHESIRVACWRAGIMPWVGSRSAGAAFNLKVQGSRDVERAYFRRSEGSCTFLSDTTTNGLCADFEASVPRVRLKDFVPLRFWLPYGWWELRDGSTVLFSRDYKPLWNVSSEGTVRRADPWLRIREIQVEKWFFDISGSSWHASETQLHAIGVLQKHRIVELPMLVDVLPFLVADSSISLDDALKKLATNRVAFAG